VANGIRLTTRGRIVHWSAIAVVVIGALVAAIALLAPSASDPDAGATRTPSPQPSETETPVPTPTPEFDRAAFSIDAPDSPWVVVNKLRPFQPADYAPADLVDVPVPYVNAPQLRQVASNAVVAMFAAYTAETGRQLQSQSAYRSYPTQQRVYAGWVAQLGQEAADLTSARPGHSEHQTGLVIDISSVPAVCALDQCFADTPEGQWLAANSWKWGFVLRYPLGETEVTGYEFEPWHFRYVGVELATEMHETGAATMEAFFGLPAAPTYAAG
jgi:zinc D-Ala-D-Ala carboxypeptidase